MKKKLLVIVDMQAGFSASDDEYLVEKIRGLVTDYKSEHAYIIVLEYCNNPYNLDDIVVEGYGAVGRTIDAVKDHIGNYARVAYFGKDYDDGSEYIQQLISETKSTVSKIEVVGVNMDACVVRTAIGIARKNPELMIDVLEDSCGSLTDRFEMEGFEGVHESTLDQIRCYEQYNTSNLRLVPCEAHT